jgi:hypothetical protein
MLGFIGNLLLICLHINNPDTSKFAPLFLTVALTQLSDALVYGNMLNGDSAGLLLKIALGGQLFALYHAFELPLIIPLLLNIYLFATDWKPYADILSKGWNEGELTRIFLWLFWIIIPMILSNSTYDKIFLAAGGALLFSSEFFGFGSLGKNWCMTGILLNLFVYLFRRT